MYLVDWDNVSTACHKGGHGVPNLEDMNGALLVKWNYRYGNENDKP